MKYLNRIELLWAVITLGVVLAVATVVTSTTFAQTNSVPDLEVGTPSVWDASLYTGNRFTLSVTVTNAGGGDSVATLLRYYQSTDSTITSSDTEQGSGETVDALAAAGTSDHSGGLTAPSEAGTYYYGACVDSVADESDITNNCSSSVTVTVSEPEPDLVVIGIDASDDIVTGGSFRVGVTVTNQGDAQSAATTLRWKQLVDGTTTEIGTAAQRALTRPQGSFKTIRLTAPSTPGTSSYWACVDSVAGESDTTNNCSGKVTVTVTNNLATGAPTIGGTAQVGQTLTASTSSIADADGLTNVTYSYQWLADDTEIEGATSSTYTLQTSDNGKAIKVRVTFTDDADNEESLTSAATNTNSVTVPQTNNLATGAPTISGTAQVGQTLTASTSGIADDDGLANVSYSYQWLADDTEIEGATSSTYTLQASDNGKAIKVRVTFTDDADNEESLTSAATNSVTDSGSNSPATGAPTISGTAQVGQTLTASTSGIADDDGLANVSYSYQWLADDTEIEGATSSAYTLQSADNGKAIKVRVTFTDDADNEESLTSAATNSVTDSGSNSPATGAPTISGTAQVGQTLTASTSGIADADGLTNVSYSYQWLADDTEIGGATSSTYTLQSSDNGKAIKVRVTFTDDADNEESLTSAPTNSVTDLSFQEMTPTKTVRSRKTSSSRP